MGLAGMNLFENADVPCVLQSHYGSPSVPDHYLLKCKGAPNLAQRAFVSKHGDWLSDAPFAPGDDGFIWFPRVELEGG